MGLGPIRESREVADTRAAHDTHNPRQTLDFSAFETANKAIIQSLNMKGKAFAAWANTIDTIAENVGGSAKEYARYEQRQAEAESNKKSAEQELANAKTAQEISKSGSDGSSWMSFFGM